MTGASGALAHHNTLREKIDDLPENSAGISTGFMASKHRTRYCLCVVVVVVVVVCICVRLGVCVSASCELACRSQRLTLGGIFPQELSPLFVVT